MRIKKRYIKMKKIAIVSKYMTMGGIEKALLEMLKLFDKNEFEITLYLSKLGGELYDEIPNWVNVRRIQDIQFSIKDHFKKNVKNGKPIKAFFKSILLIKNKFESEYYKECMRLSNVLPNIKEKYDLVISYSTPVSLATFYCIYNIDAKKRAAFIHNEVDKIGTPILPCNEIYSQYDKIFAVSSVAKRKFLTYFPDLNEKTDIFFNIINKESIKKLADQGKHFERKNDEIIILTVGRLSYEKGHDIIPKVAYRLKQKNYNFKWYIIGKGDMDYALEKQIEKLNVENNVILLGEKKNPYGFFEDCDIYIQTSRQEGYGITVAEAKCFYKPIISTEFAGIYDQIEDGKNGLIVPFDEEELEIAIEEIIGNNYIREKFRKELIMENIDTGYQMNKIFELLG